jgi:hypothetical protein
MRRRASVRGWNAGVLLAVLVLLLMILPAHRHDWRVARAGNPILLEKTADGGLLVQAGENQFPVSSSFSVPGGGWRRLGPAIVSREGENAARVQPGAEPGSVTVAETDFQVERTVQFSDGRAWVRDRISNLTERDLGMMVRHELALPRPPLVIHLGGDSMARIYETWAPWNPTVFVPLGDLSLGMAAEDDALRAQGIWSYHRDTPRVGVRTEHLAIPARQSATLQWSIYALPGGDYFDFVNRIRADWRVRLRLVGPYWWGFRAEQIMAMSDEALRTFLQRTRAYAVVSTGGWVDWLRREERPARIGFGVGVMEPWFDEYRKRLRQAADKVHRVAPGVKVAYYNHMFLNEPERDTERFRDSWIVRENGERLNVTWNGAYTPARGIYPTESNRFGSAFREALERQRVELAADGFYIDETDFPSGMWRDCYTFNQWDGTSALLDPKTFAIRRKIGYTFLLAEKYQHQVLDELRAAGVWFLGNGQPCTLSFNRDTWPRFTEMDLNLRRASEAHLYSPLAYGRGAYTVEKLRERLDVGMLYCVTAPEDRLGIVGRFFPITPTELHAGWVKGEERIVTNRSGTFGWANERYRYRLWRYLKSGTPVEDPPLWQTGEGFVEVQVPEKGIAILEREGPWNQDVLEQGDAREATRSGPASLFLLPCPE